ncbi:hypothetical protein HMPREF1145_2240 [Oribacterium parvum ACB8]|nr:hypothetical protein HMPREF1145_2240 [Oribacterium parvum ACB8]
MGNPLCNFSYSGSKNSIVFLRGSTKAQGIELIKNAAIGPHKHFLLKYY